MPKGSLAAGGVGIVVVLLVAAVMTAGAANALSGGGSPGTPVPDVVGMWQATANTTITTAGLVVGPVSEEFSATIKLGYVVRQSPSAGVTVPPGSSVGLTVSKGRSVKVPDLAGMTQAEASTAIGTAELVVGTVTQEYSPVVPKSLVLSQSPAAATSVSPDSPVDFVVSKGPSTIVPDVTGETQSAAGILLGNAVLQTGAVTEEYSGTMAAGLVVSQNPAAGLEVSSGSSVALVLSKGPRPITGSIVINNNRSATNNTTVSLALTWGGGSGTGVVRMRFSNDGSTWTPWAPLQAAPSHVVPAGDGHKTVRVQFLDDDNFRSEVYSDFIRLDTTLPAGGIVINGGAATTTSQTVTLGLTWTDTGAGVSRMRFSDNGSTWTPWMPLASVRTHTLPAGLGNHTVRVQYLDGANNYSLVTNDYIKVVAP